MTSTRSRPRAQLALGVGRAGAVEVAEHVRPLEEGVRRDHRLEAFAGDEIIVHAVGFAGPRRPRRVRPRQLESPGTRWTSRSTSVVLPVPDGAETTNSRPRAAAAHSTFWTCSRIFSSSAFSVDDQSPTRRALGLGARSC